ncbi:MAG: lysozyme inhibitor LprI family protein [Peptostreptococcaceae bacterium]
MRFNKLVVLGLSIFLIGCSNSTVDKSIENAKLAIASGEYQKAEGLLELALSESKDNSDANILYSQIQKLRDIENLIKKEDLDEAKVICDDLLSQNDEFGIIKRQVQNLQENIDDLELSVLEETEEEVAEETKVVEEAPKVEEVTKEEPKEEVVIEEKEEVVEEMVGDITIQRELYFGKFAEVERQVENIDFGQFSNSEMANGEYERYELWDKFLNEIYKELQSTLSSSEMEALKVEQREWITFRDNQANADADEVRGGTLESVVYNGSLATLTQERCFDLIYDYMR